LPDSSDRKTANTQAAKNQLGSNTSVYWWLRTRGKYNCNMVCMYASGTYDGKVWLSGTDAGHDNVGYRPAMWITVGG